MASERKAPLSAQQFLRDLRRVCEDPAGKRVVWQIISWTRPFVSTFRKNAEMGFLEGQRLVGLKLISALQAAEPKLLMEVLGLGLTGPQETAPEFVNHQEQKE